MRHDVDCSVPETLIMLPEAKRPGSVADDIIQTMLSGFHSTAEKKCGKALRSDPDNLHLKFLLAVTRTSQKNWTGAVTVLQELLSRAPHHADSLFCLAKAQVELGRISEALDNFRAGLSIKPDMANALAVSNILFDLGRVTDGVEVLRWAVDRFPESADVHSALISRQLLCPDLSNETMSTEIERWRQRHGATRSNGIRLTNQRDPERKLKVGYVSSSLGYYAPFGLWLQMLPILEHHDPQAVEISLYGDARFNQAELGPVWPLVKSCRDLQGLSDEEAARLIRDDQIDILVCLIGHTGGDRIGIFTYRAAPIQINYDGLCSSGVDDMDYWLGDPVATPEASSEKFGESILRLPHLFCFGPITDAPPVSPPPHTHNGGQIVFGNFNLASKISPQCVNAMAAILKQTQDSILVLKSRDKGYIHDAARKAIIDQFIGEGILESRLKFLPPAPSQAEHLAQYSKIDIALDSFPYSGCLTTFDALWMGVPVIALGDGDRFISRMSKMLLHSANLDHLVAGDRNDYIAKAVALAQAPSRLADYRTSLRGTVTASPLCDIKAFTKSLEAAYRQIWQIWCSNPVQPASAELSEEPA
ncbi:O-linked N-acetylglucosamine transferase, SPINDLY family protein [Paramagnetospirillum kuznetsovii]|nr:tetratricopeptide repeat protein [Paramagnetospirillum kuznetsovii]